MEITTLKIKIDENVKNRAIEFQKVEIKAFDALHLACAEIGQVDVFLSTDDDLVKKTVQKGKTRIKVENPVNWLMEVLKHESNDS